MSPFMAILVLGVLLGTVVWVGAVVLRKRGCVLLLLPFPLLIIAWFVLASIAPNPEREFDRLFGPSVRSAVSDIRTIKPTFMDGHLISFRVSEEAYSRIKAENRRPEFVGGLSFFGGTNRPASWPAALETMDMFECRDFGEDRLLTYYCRATQTLYASYLYEGW